MKMRFASILLTLIGILAMGAAAQAQSGRKIIVNLPFDFVAGGQTLPAGNYTLIPVSDYDADGLILSSYDNHVSVIVHPIEIEKASAAKSNVSFQRVGEQHFLNRIQTPDTVYNLPVSRAAHSQAAAE
jgi:hypothetical protein